MSDKTFVCRCEDVTVHDVCEAIDKGYRDLESVKRYTGFGTGWCQGKNCVAFASRTIARLGGELPSLPMTPRPPFRPVRLADLAGLPDAEPADAEPTDAEPTDEPKPTGSDDSNNGASHEL